MKKILAFLIIVCGFVQAQDYALNRVPKTSDFTITSDGHVEMQTNTFATLNLAQTFTALQTFSLGIVLGSSPALSAVTGTGSVVLSNTPTLITPVLGAATYTTLNGGAITVSGDSSFTGDSSSTAVSIVAGAGQTGLALTNNASGGIYILSAIGTSGSSATPIFASNPTNSGSPIAIQGTVGASGTTGAAGVYGFQGAGSGASYGVKGLAQSNTAGAAAIIGFGTNSNNNIGVVGTHNVSGGVAGMFYNSNTNTSHAISIRDTNGTTENAFITGAGSLNATTYATATTCAAVGSAANPSLVACSSAPAGFFSCATTASTGTCVVSTTKVTANSTIIVISDASLGSALSVTCNTSTATLPTLSLIASRSVGASFTINLGTVTTNPACFSYLIIN